MPVNIRLGAATQQRLRCPICSSPIQIANDQAICENENSRHAFPIVDGTPILIDEARSLFSMSDYLSGRATTIPARSALWKRATALTPNISSNIPAERNYEEIHNYLRTQAEKPTVLTIGGGIAGQGMEELLADSSIEFVDTDVSFGPRTALICDAHDLPFADATFDVVIAQAVLEHVVDPYRCVVELHRVLKDGGIVYAETPFMQQVHAGRYDFTRFTHLGHRRLFRAFEEIHSGSVAGPGTVLAWAYQHLLLSFVRASYARAAVKVFARLTSFWLKYLDYVVVDKPGADDAASAYYFMGRKTDQTLSDRDLIDLYKGAG